MICRSLPVVVLMGFASMALPAVPATGPAAPNKATASKAAPANTRQVNKGNFSFWIEPIPAWVVPATESPGASTSRAPMHYPIIDDQTRLQAGTRWSYTRFVRVVDEASALGTASQFEIPFDPSYETLAFHHLFIVRGGKKIDKLEPARIELLQRETELEKRMYNGRVTASIQVQDVRVGDQIDMAYSVRGMNPVFDGKYVDWVWPGTDKGPTAQFQFRLLAPANRKINYKASDAGLSVDAHMTAAGVRETLFRRSGIAQIRGDVGAPPYSFVSQQLQLSEFDDWNDVRRWGQALFVEPDAQGALLDAEATEIRQHVQDPAGRLLETLKFVQSSIRYFGTELGINSHKPTDPEKVLSQRFGDCKDKVLLMMALLRRLEIPARPVLVSLPFRTRAGDLLPSPLAFNHVIIRVELNGTAYLLDATREHQTGTLAHRQVLGLGKGLLLADAVTAPAELPSADDELRASVEDFITVDRFSLDPSLESRITYRGDLAEILRAAMAVKPLHDIEVQIDQQYARFFPKLQTTSPLEIREIPGEDAFTIVQKFSIPEFWRLNEKTQLMTQTAFWSLIDPLRYPPSQSREQPLMIPLPGIFEHRVVFNLPPDTMSAEVPPQHYEDSDSNFSIRIAGEITPNRIENRATLRVFGEEIEPGDWTAHVAKIANLDPHLGVGVLVPTVPKSEVAAMIKQLTALDEDIKSKKIKFNTKLQAESQMRAIIIGYALDGGRLSQPLAAQAMITRGTALDNLGQYSRAQVDFQKALELLPGSREARNSASLNAIARRDYDRAIELANQSLAADPKDSEALFNRAKANFLAHQYFPAHQDLEELLKDRSWIRRGYPVVLLYLTALRTGGDGADELSRFSTSEFPSEWPRPLIDSASGKIENAEAVLASASAASPANEHLCEALFYLGEKSYANGEDKRAQMYFERAVELGTTEFFENWASRNELLSMQEHRKVSSK